MEGTPLVVESDDEKERRRKEQSEASRQARTGQSEVLGILAVEPASEESPVSALEKAWAETARPEPEAKEKPPAEAEPEPETEVEPEPPAERQPEEDARQRVREMARQEPEAGPEPEPESESKPAEAEEPKIEEGPEPEAEAEAEPEPKPETEIEPAPPAEAEPTEIEKPAAEKAAAEEEPVETTEEEPEPETEPETAPEPEVAPEPEPPAEAESEPEEEKKSGIINTLFGRRGRDKAEQEPEEPKEPEPEPTAEAEPAAKETEEKKPAPEEPEGPKFRFNETVDENDEAEPAAEAAEAPEDKEPEAKKTERDPENGKAPERIGQMLLNTEAPAAERRPRPAHEAIESSRAAETKLGVESAPRELGGRRIDTMSRAELMELSEKIIVDGTNLRQIYETHLIGERGLRRLIAEYLSGHDLREALQHEVVEHEIDFERDPAMRDLPDSSGIVIPDEANGTGLEDMLKKADVSTLDGGEQAAFFKARARYEKAEHRRYHQARRLADVALVSVIGILIILVILVYLLR